MVHCFYTLVLITIPEILFLSLPQWVRHLLVYFGLDDYGSATIWSQYVSCSLHHQHYFWWGPSLIVLGFRRCTGRPFLFITGVILRRPFSTQQTSTFLPFSIYIIFRVLPPPDMEPKMTFASAFHKQLFLGIYTRRINWIYCLVQCAVLKCEITLSVCSLLYYAVMSAHLVIDVLFICVSVCVCVCVCVCVESQRAVVGNSLGQS